MLGVYTGVLVASYTRVAKTLKENWLVALLTLCHCLINPFMADFLLDMHHYAKNVFIKLTILVTPIKQYTKMFLIG